MVSTPDNYVCIPPLKQQTTDIPSPFVLPKLNGHNLFEISVPELQHLYSINAFTAREYTQFCLDHIQRTNFYLEAVIETNPDALAIADELDAERTRGRSRERRTLWGVPVLVKDSMATKDKMQTCAGSWALLGSIVPKDAFIVSRLRSAGAIVLGKSNLDEWAGMRCKYSYSFGYSARVGQCRNPYRLSRSPEGSSSGSAVSVSANIVPLAFGTETDTSIIGPALVNGVVGIKPTVGLTSRTGIVPISSTQDSIGPYGKTVADAALALNVIAAPDPEDSFTTVPHRKQPPSYLDFLTDRHSLKRAKFGLPIIRFWDVAPAPQHKVVEDLLTLLADAGAEILEVSLPCANERIHPDGHWDWTRYASTHPERSELTVSKVQTYNLMKKYLSTLSNTNIRTLEDVIRYNDNNTGSEGGIQGTHPAFPDGQDLFRECVETQGVENEVYKSALRWITRQTRERGIDAALKYKNPKSGKEKEEDEKEEDEKEEDEKEEDEKEEEEEEEKEEEEEEETVLDALLFCDIKMGGTCIAAQAGYPVLALPVGLDEDGMPVGITLVHTTWEEGRLVKWASAIEDLMRFHAENDENMRGEGMGSCEEHEFSMKPVGRVPPRFKEHLRKNIPVEYGWRYEGAPQFHVGELRKDMA